MKKLTKLSKKKMLPTSMNDFLLEKILGKGSFGSVYLVRRKEDNKIYALKTVTFEKLNKRDQENSLNEVRILASINHPNVIGYKEAFWDDTGRSLNIVMEYADDGDLESKIVKMRKEGGMFNESLIWSYSIQMIEGLKALHDKKIMHRDIKSANIFLVKDKHQCKLGDMNVSKVIKEKVLRTQTGTPYYASPEVWRDEPYSYKSDLWSIGCVIYELCALRPPFKGKNLDELYINVCKGKIERISHIYSEDLWKMILMLLQVDVKRRVDCKEFLDSKLIMKKIKEMKENNSECRDLEINKNSFNGTLLKTIKFKDYKDIKSQLPTKKNYDIDISSNINPNLSKDNINKKQNLYHNFFNRNINEINSSKKNYFNDNLIENLTSNINNSNNNIIKNSNNINNYYYINYSPNFNQIFPTKINNNIIGKKREEYNKNNDKVIFKTDINIKDMNMLENIDLNSIRNGKKKLIQKSDILSNYYRNIIEEELNKKNLNIKLEKKLILQKQRQKEKEEYNQRLKEENNKRLIKKSSSKKNINNCYYSKINNIEEVKILKKRSVSSSRIISSNRKLKKNASNFSPIKAKKSINKYVDDIINENNNLDKGKKNNLGIKIYETERNMKKKDISNNQQRTKTPMSNYKKVKINKKNSKSHYKYNYSNDARNESNINISKNNNINSCSNLNCMTSIKEDKTSIIKYNKIIKNKNKKTNEEFHDRNKVKFIRNSIKKKNNTYSNNERALSATPNKRNPRLNPNNYENNNNGNHYNKKALKNYENYLNKNAYVYKETKKNDYRSLNESEINMQKKPIKSIESKGSRYNKINNNYNSKKNKFIKKDIINNELNNNRGSKSSQNIRKKNSMRQNSNERRNNYRRYNPDITEPELLMMVNPIKIKDNYKNLQKSSLNITVNNNVINQNIFLQHIKPYNQIMSNNMNKIENKDKNKEHLNNSKYNHLKIFNDLTMNEKNEDEPIKIMKIFN